MGATSLKTRMDLSLDSCKSTCIATEDCEGILFQPPVRCELRKDIEINNCANQSGKYIYMLEGNI